MLNICEILAHNSIENYKISVSDTHQCIFEIIGYKDVKYISCTVDFYPGTQIYGLKLPC